MFQDQYAPHYIAYMRQKLANKGFRINAKGCHMWMGCTCKDGYPRLRITAVTLTGNKFSKMVSVPRLVCFLHGNGQMLNTRQQASHRCGERLCCNIDHLSLEPARINAQRKACHAQNNCNTHGTKPRCIL